MTVLKSLGEQTRGLLPHMARQAAEVLTGDVEQSVERSDPWAYPNAALAYHRRRIWAGIVSVTGLTLAALITSSDMMWVPVCSSIVVTAHAGWRIRHRGNTALDAVTLDTLTVLVFLAVMHPPASVIAGPLLYMILPAWLFLDRRKAAWAVSSAVVGAGAALWVFSAPTLSDVAIATATATVAVAGLPHIVWHVEAISESITGRRSLARDLGRTAQRFQELFERSVIPMFRTSLGGVLLDGNRALVDLFGFDDLAAFRREPIIDRYVSVESRAEMVRQLLLTREIKNFDINFRRRDGSRFWGRISAILVNSVDGRVLEGIIVEVPEDGGDGV